MLRAYFIFSGLILTAIPWTQYWPKSLSLPSWLGTIFASALFKGFVSGIGLVLIFTGLLEIRARLKDS